MAVISLKAGGLYVLSAPPASGKSFLVRRSELPEGVVLSTDALRRIFCGVERVADEAGLGIRIPDFADALVFKTLMEAVDARLKQRLTTVVDATSVSDKERAEYARIAARHGAPFEVLILDADLEQCLARNSARPARVPEGVLRGFFESFQRDSRYPFRTIRSNDRLAIVPALELEHARYDVVSDVHGLYEDLCELLRTLGWQPDGDSWAHPQTRKLLFLGDLVDRGPQSIEVAQLVKRLCEQGRAHCLLGNHEAKLVRFWDHVQANDLKDWTSYANAETGMRLVRMKTAQAAALVEWMRRLPTHAVYRRVEDGLTVVFVHADIDRFDHVTSASRELTRGVSGWGDCDSDAALQRFIGLTGGRIKVVRGHIPQTSSQPDVLSIERQQAFAGELTAWQMDRYVAEPQRAMSDFVVARRCTFDFGVYERRYDLARQMNSLVRRKLATCTADTAHGLRLYKYTKQVFFDGKWGEDPALVKARGIVLDLAGNIVAHPFDKVYNWKEQGAGADLRGHEAVRAVEKLNGFLGVISPHPVKSGELLVTTSGSFDSDFVRYIRDFLNGPTRGRLLRHLARQPMSLMFEVLHPADPHIIRYPQEMHGLWLIGARGLEREALPMQEVALDALGAELQLRRPSHFLASFEEVLRRVRECRHEGFMVRADDEAETPLLKLKSPYYLTTKFLARMGEGQWKAMYGNPRAFKQRLDEEFYDIVDWLTAHVALADVLGMDEQAKLTLVRGYFDAR